MKKALKPRNQPSWRCYQARSRRTRAQSRMLKRLAVVLSVTIPLVMTGFLLHGFTGDSATVTDRPVSEKSNLPQPPAKSVLDDPPAIEDVAKLLDRIPADSIVNRRFELRVDGQQCLAQTSILPDLQAFSAGQLDSKHARHISIVAVEPATGRILSMVGYSRDPSGGFPCLNAYPAASVFKIITAAAAIEKCGLGSDSVMAFNGRKHTLYRSQLKERNNQYTQRISLRDSFAQSINPVFGKLATNCLGKSAIAHYAGDFGFNGSLVSDLPLPESRVHLSDDAYQWAEVTSGFNQETVISPVHGALLAASAVNRGRIMAPGLIDRIYDRDGNLVYRRQPRTLRQAVSAQTAAQLRSMMEATVSSGTGKRAFRGWKRDKILSRLCIGGKTGSIDSQDNEARLDWFVGFAQTKDGQEQLAVAALVAHEEFIGTRASQYARRVFRKYFEAYFAAPDRVATQSEPSSNSS